MYYVIFIEKIFNSNVIAEKSHQNSLKTLFPLIFFLFKRKTIFCLVVVYYFPVLHFFFFKRNEVF